MDWSGREAQEVIRLLSVNRRGRPLASRAGRWVAARLFGWSTTTPLLVRAARALERNPHPGPSLLAPSAPKLVGGATASVVAGAVSRSG